MKNGTHNSPSLKLAEGNTTDFLGVDPVSKGFSTRLGFATKLTTRTRQVWQFFTTGAIGVGGAIPSMVTRLAGGPAVWLTAALVGTISIYASTTFSSPFGAVAAAASLLLVIVADRRQSVRSNRFWQHAHAFAGNNHPRNSARAVRTFTGNRREY